MYNSPDMNTVEGKGERRPPPLFPRPGKRKDKPGAAEIPEEEKEEAPPAIPQRNSKLMSAIPDTPAEPATGTAAGTATGTAAGTATGTASGGPAATAFVKPFLANTDQETPASDTIEVKGFDEQVTGEALKLHFENRRKSGGGPVDSVTISEAAALVKFKQASDAQNVLKTDQIFRGHTLTVVEFTPSSPETKFLISGVKKNTALETLQDFLEVKADCKVDSVEWAEDGVAVVFSEDSNIELQTLQLLFRDNPLEGSHLKVSLLEDEPLYLEPVKNTSNTREEMCELSIVKLKYAEKFAMDKIKSEMIKHEFDYKINRPESRIDIIGKSEKDVAAMRNIFNTFCETEFQIHLPGVVRFLKCGESRRYVDSLETDNQCCIDVQEGTYEIISPHACDGEDGTATERLDSSGSMGSLKHADKETKGSPKVLGQFRIGGIKLHMQDGNIPRDENVCLINITQRELREGDIWRKLDTKTLKLVEEEIALEQNKETWNKTGILTTGGPQVNSQWMVHVSQSRCKGDLVRTLEKCLRTANPLPGVTSVVICSFVKKDKRGRYEVSPKSVVEAINKFQRTSSLNVKDIYLVQDDQKVVDAVEEEVRKVILQRETRNPVLAKLRLMSRGSEEEMKIYGTVASVQSGQMEESCPLLQADMTVYICSLDEDRNKEVFDKLNTYCEEMLQPKIVEDPKIKKLTREQVKKLRSRKVEVALDTGSGTMAVRGYSADVTTICNKLADILKDIPDEVPQGKNSMSTGESEVFPAATANPPDAVDSAETFGKYIASELRAIQDEKLQFQLKTEIQKLIFKRQSGKTGTATRFHKLH